ncbi:DNA integrity scanning protein DisA nucleotide-binding domain protein [Aeromicrobium sp. CTD01-1L150]|uniref:DNA integrity scanning protein DisA nucleotide-binding domain protein n=1 Tax=Aeromicrobium sp. CTD01-1L150 TaxID=3341830 RepID=UPI0035C12F1A
METIGTPLWDHQRRFRQGLEEAAGILYATAGSALRARALLVGTAEDGSVAVEPATDPAAQDLADIDVGPDDEQGFARAARQAIQEATPEPSGVVRVGEAGRIDGRYSVRPVLVFPRGPWQAKPSLRSSSAAGREVASSFQDALASQLLAEATLALRSQETPVDFGVRVDAALIDETIRRAAARLTDSAAALVGLERRSTLHHAMDAVAAQPYEGRAGFGRVVLALPEHPEVDMRIRFVEPIPVSSTRRFRKALEVTSEVLSLVCDGTNLTGLGVVRRRDRFHEPIGSPQAVADHDPSESIFELDVLGRGEWQLSHRSAPLLRVTNTRPLFPDLPLSPETFHAAVEQVLPHVSTRDARALWDLTETASRTEGGTILVFHPHAEAEARRLAAQAQLVEAEVLGPRAVEAITGIDGAVLLDPAGRCHAIGVILDGVANEAGDPGRGARYNSAIRYHEGHGDDALIVVVSEDGMIDLVPGPADRA